MYLRYLQGTTSDYGDVGNYEVLDVTGTSGNSITLLSAPEKSYDGTTWENQKVAIQRIPQYTNVSIASGGRLSAGVWDGLSTTSTGIVVFYASGTVAINSVSFDVSFHE